MNAKEKRDAERQAHIDKIVAAAPLPSPDELDMLARLLCPQCFRGSGEHAPSERETRIAKLKSDLLAARKRMDDALAGCHGCGLTKEVHAYQKGYGGYHEWMPMSPDDMIKTVKAHKPKLAVIEKKIAELG